jgi:uncharacterized protein YabE (DUF348 family)
MNPLKFFRNLFIQRILAGLLIVLGILLVVLSANKTVYLIVDGNIQEYQSNAITMNGFLRRQSFVIQETDRLMPENPVFLWQDATIHLNYANQVEIEADGKKIQVVSAELNPQNILWEAGILLYPKDRLIINNTSAGPKTTLTPGKDHQIQLIRATLIDLQMEEGNRKFYTGSNTLAEALDNEDIELFEADQLSIPGDLVLDGTPLTVELTRARPVQVQLAENTFTIRTTANTVGEALASAGLALQGLDYSVPPEQDPLPKENPIQIYRLKEEVILNQEQVPFTSEYQAAADLELDQLQILTGGEFGLSAQRIRILYENGEEISRQVEKEWQIKEPKSRVIGFGTGINLRTTDTPDGPITYWRKITAYATSYNENCPGCDLITASGTVLKKGTIAVKLDWYRYMKFNNVYIPGYGFGRIEDVGGGVPWSVNWVDLGYRAYEYVPWSQNVEVYFLAPAPPPDQIMYILY